MICGVTLKQKETRLPRIDGVRLTRCQLKSTVYRLFTRQMAVDKLIFLFGVNRILGQLLGK